MSLSCEHVTATPFYSLLLHSLLLYFLLSATLLYSTLLSAATTQLDHIILYHTILYFTLLYYTILCYAMLCYAMLYYTILYSLKVRTQLRKLPNCCLRPEVPHGIRLHVLRASNFFCLTNCIHKAENGTCIDKTHWKNSFSWIEAVTIMPMQLPTRRVMVSEHQPSSAKILGAGVEILALAQCIQVCTPKCPKTPCSSRGSELGTAVATTVRGNCMLANHFYTLLRLPSP